MKRAVIGLALALLGTPAWADYVVDATGMATVALMRVRAPRAYILHGDGAGCPERLACRSGAYLVAGDPVLATGRIGRFVQIKYADGRGGGAGGLLPASDVAPFAPTANPKWVGHWVRAEAAIDIKAAGQSGFAITGDATWGASDPERVKRGGVNIGEFAGLLRRNDTGPHQTGVIAVTGTGDGSDDCRLWVRLLGPYLLVTDNNGCGGHNVSFTGAYRHSH